MHGIYHWSYQLYDSYETSICVVKHSRKPIYHWSYQFYDSYEKSIFVVIYPRKQTMKHFLHYNVKVWIWWKYLGLGSERHFWDMF